MTTAQKFTVALVQMRMGADPEANFSSGARATFARPRGCGAQIVCLPELFRTQYFCQREDLKLFDLGGADSRAVDREARLRWRGNWAWRSWRRCSSAARRGSTTTPRSRSTPMARLPASTARCISPTIRFTTRSITSRPGDLGFQAVDTAAGRVGTLVCWDQWYPEGARLTALQGAEVLFYPTAIGWHPAEKDEFGAAQYDAWQTIQRSHAIANGVYVAAVNRVGMEHGDVLGNRAAGPGLEFWGGSFLADPFGRIDCQGRAR